MRNSIPFDDIRLKTLQDPQVAASYLTQAARGNDSAMFLAALSHVARAHGFSALASRTKMHRVSLHKMLSKRGNPEFTSILRILNASGLELSFQSKKHAA
jgi:probable addiction module antidote protein